MGASDGQFKFIAWTREGEHLLETVPKTTDIPWSFLGKAFSEGTSHKWIRAHENMIWRLCAPFYRYSFGYLDHLCDVVESALARTLFVLFRKSILEKCEL